MTFLWYNPADDAQGARNATSAERPSGRPCATGTNPRKQKMKTAKKRLASFLSALMAAGSLLAAFEHVAHDAVSLNGDWEMAYLPYGPGPVSFVLNKPSPPKSALPIPFT